MKAVFVHLYYQDLWEEVKNSLSKIPFSYDLYVTICDEHKDTISESVKQFNSNSYILSVENRGADIGPFLECLNLSFDLKKEYDWFLKIHGKKSLMVSPTAGETWRKTAFSTLIPSDFSQLTKHFLNQSIGMIGPKKYLMGQSSFDRRAGKNNNAEGISHFSQKLKLTDSELKFFAGSMFWSRYSIFKDTLLNNRIRSIDFGKGHAPDGTRAHAMERVFANIVRSKKYQLLGI